MTTSLSQYHTLPHSRNLHY